MRFVLIIYTRRGCFAAAVGRPRPLGPPRIRFATHLAVPSPERSALPCARDPVISPYLQNAVSAGRGAQIQLAVDLKDLVDPKGVRTWLKNCKKLQGKQANLEPLFELIKGLKGVRFAAPQTSSNGGLEQGNNSPPPAPSTSDSGSWNGVVTFLPDGRAREDASIIINARGARPLECRIRGLTGVITVKSVEGNHP